MTRAASPPDIPPGPPRHLLHHWTCRRCRGQLGIQTYEFQCRDDGGPLRRVLWAGGICMGCGSRCQYGKGGTLSDYHHAREWIWGKHFGGMSGKCREAPAEFWAYVTEMANCRLQTLAYVASRPYANH